MSASARYGPPTDVVAGPAGVTSGDSGFSLVEAVVSVALFMIVSASAGLAVVTAVRIAESNQNRVVAAGLATAQIESARAAPDPGALEAGVTDVSRDGTTFTIERLLDPLSGCTARGTRTISVIINWPGTGGPVYSDTVRAC